MWHYKRSLSSPSVSSQISVRLKALCYGRGKLKHRITARWRNKLIISFAITGSTLGSAFLVLPTAQHTALYLAAFLVIISSVCMSDS